MFPLDFMAAADKPAYSPAESVFLNKANILDTRVRDNNRFLSR